MAKRTSPESALMPTIVLVEDHPRTREVLEQILAMEPEFRVVGQAYNGSEGFRLVSEADPDVLVCDLIMPGLNGIDLAARVHQEYPRTQVIIVSNHIEQPYVQEALRQGAVGYLDKVDCSAWLGTAIRAAVAGERYLSPAVARSNDSL